MTEQEKINLIEKFIAAYNRFEIEEMLSVLSAEINFQNISNGEITHETNGIEEFCRQAESAAGLFSEREQKIEYVSCFENSCEVSIDYRGKLAADLSDELKAGATLRLKGRSIYEFDDEKISRIRDYS